MDLMNKEFIILCLLSFFIGYIFKNILKNNHSCGLRENFIAYSFKDYQNNNDGIKNCVIDEYEREKCEDQFIYHEFKERKKDINEWCNKKKPVLKEYCNKLGFIDDSTMFCPFMIECKISNFSSSNKLHKAAIKTFIDKDVKFDRVYGRNIPSHKLKNKDIKLNKGKKLEGFSSPKQYDNTVSGYHECYDFVEGDNDLKKQKCSQGLLNSLLYNEPKYTINTGEKNPRMAACYRIMKKEQVDMPESEKCDSFSDGMLDGINFFKNEKCRGSMKCIFDTHGDSFNKPTDESIRKKHEQNKQILCEIIQNDKSIIEKDGKYEKDEMENIFSEYLHGDSCDKILNKTYTDIKTDMETDIETDMEKDIETDMEKDIKTDMGTDMGTSDDKIETSPEMIEKKQDNFFDIFR